MSKNKKKLASQMGIDLRAYRVVTSFNTGTRVHKSPLDKKEIRKSGKAICRKALKEAW